MACGCEATINKNDPRAEIWLYVFGKLSFPLKHPMRVNMGSVVGLGYEGDATALTPDQRTRLIEKMTKKFGISEKEVTDTLDEGIIPIKATGVSVKICNAHFRCML